MSGLLAFCLRHRPLILFMSLLWLIGGLASLRYLPIDAVPDVTNVQVQINTNAPGLSPLEVEQLITFPLEQAMSGLPKLEKVWSLSKYGLSQVTVVFEDSTDIYFARQLVFERIQQARSQIPEGLGEPEMGPISTGLGEVYQYEVRGDRSPMELRTIEDWIVKRQMRKVEGVTEVNSFGGFEKQFQVLMNPEKLAAYNLTPRDVARAISSNNRNSGNGYIEHLSEQYVLRGIGQIKNIKELEDISIADMEGKNVFLRDVADVVEGPALRQGAVTRDGRGEAVIGIVMMLVGENSRVVCQNIEEKKNEINKSLPKGVYLETFYNRMDLVERTVNTVKSNLLEGAILVIVVLLLFLGNLRAALLVAMTIPMSMLFAVVGMVGFGVSGNLMSLGAIDFGIIVDGAVVLVENTMKRLEDCQDRKQVLPIVLSSAKEVVRPIVFGVLIIGVVYVPLLGLQGMEGKTFQPMAFTVVAALLGSLILSLTFVPVLASMVLRPAGESGSHEPAFVEKLRNFYRPALRWCLDHTVPLAGVSVALFALSLLILSRLGSVFLPRLDEGALAIQLSRLPSVSLTRSLEMAQQVEQALLEFPEVETVVSKTGRPDIATDPMGVELTDMVITLKPPAEWKHSSRESLVEDMEARLQQIPGVGLSFSQPIELRVSELISGVRSDVAMKIFGDDLEVLKETADKVARKLSKVPGAADVRVEPVAGLPYINLEIDRDAAFRLGLTVEDILQIMEHSCGGQRVGLLYKGDRRFPIVTLMKGASTADISTLGEVRVPLPNGKTVPLREVTREVREAGVAQVSRENGQRRIVVEANVRGRDLVGFVEDAKKATESLLPPGYFPEWGGQFENFERARPRLLLLVPLSLAMIFFLLFSSVESVGVAGLIFFNVPFAITGGVFALALRDLPFSISAGVGFIALFGVAVLNGLVMASQIRQYRTDGQSNRDAVENGAIDRLRPVLMTATVASLGFLPMALASGAGAEVQKPLATVVIGGLLTSTTMTLFVLPTLFQWVEMGGKLIKRD